MLNAALTVHDLEARRGRRPLFEGLTFAVAPGQLLRVAGANGAGKTTLLRLLVGLSTPTAGEVRWRGEPIGAQSDAFRHDLVYLGHAAALKDDLSALENVRMLAALAGDRVSAVDAAAALAAAGLKGRERLPARVLSAGQRRRVALARLALGGRQRLWVLDEPFNALDAGAGEWLAGVLRDQLARDGVVVLTSHQPVPLDGAADEVRVTL